MCSPLKSALSSHHNDLVLVSHPLILRLGLAQPLALNADCEIMKIHVSQVTFPSNKSILLDCNKEWEQFILNFCWTFSKRNLWAERDWQQY